MSERISPQHASDLDGFVRDHEQRLRNFARRIDPHGGDDHLGDLWVVMARVFDRYPVEEWLPISFVSLRRIAITAARRRARRGELAHDDIANVAVASAAPEIETGVVDRLWFESCLERLDDGGRELVAAIAATESLDSAADLLALDRTRFYRRRRALRPAFDVGRGGRSSHVEA